MFDAPIDAWYVWVGLSVASVAVFGVATTLPTVPAPDAAGVAETVDRVAAADYDTTATVNVAATAVRIGPRRLGLRNDAASAHATLSYPVVPVRGETALARVVDGASPERAFPSPTAFDAALAAATDRPPRWRPASGVLVVRRVSWQGRDVTLVGTSRIDRRHRGGRSDTVTVPARGVSA